MKHLLLMRHAKSDWDDATLPDLERHLSERGRLAAPLMGEWLKSRELTPDLVLCSTSKRTRETWTLIDDVLDSGAHVEFLEELYLASPSTMLRLVREYGGEAECVMAIGHNPGTHELACALGGDGPTPALDKLDRKFPTAAIAGFSVTAVSWGALDRRSTTLTDFVRPRDLTGPEKRRS